MRRISAHFIFTGNKEILKNGIIEVDEDGTIRQIIDRKGATKEEAGVEFYSGVIVPGFINAHCHLELSHLKGTFPEKTGLPGFLKRVVSMREASDEEILIAARKADIEMWKNGIVAVGDISNNNRSFPIKKNSKIYYHTFVEALGFSPQRTERAYEYATSLLNDARDMGLMASVVPHAPYSISRPLFQKIGELACENGSVLTMHSQESQEENNLFISKTGKMVEHLEMNLGIDTSFFSATGKNSLSSVLELLPVKNNLLLVHNTYTGEEDIKEIQRTRIKNSTWFVLCPNSNLFIEDCLPDIEQLRQSDISICIGTDSLSSNHCLSVLAELRTIQDKYPEIPFMELVQWSSRNGARAMNLDNRIGTLESGKKPGINLITGMDLRKMKLLPGSRVKKLL